MGGRALGLLLAVASCGDCARQPPVSTRPPVRAALVAAGDSILFQEDFASGAASGWTGQVGPWTVAPDSAVFVYKNGNASGDNWAVYGPATWTDYAIEARIKPLSFAATGGIVRVFCRWQNPTNWYYANLRSTGLVQLRRYLNSAIVDLAPAKAVPVTPGSWVTLRLACVGSSLKAYVNGVLQLSATDTLFKAGPIAVGGWNDLAEFTAVRVVALGQAPPPPPPPPPPPLPPPGLASVTVIPSAVTTYVGTAYRFLAQVLDSSGAAVTRRVGWTTDNAAVAPIDSTGMIVAPGLGTATITATVGTLRSAAVFHAIAVRPLPFTGLYARVQLRTGWLTIERRDSVGVPPILVTAGDTGRDGFRVRVATAPLYAAAVRQLASDLASRRDTLRFQTVNPVHGDSVFCAALGCWVTTVTPGQASWTSAPPVGASTLLGLARALEAAARGDTLFAPGDSLPYVRVLP